MKNQENKRPTIKNKNKSRKTNQDKFGKDKFYSLPLITYHLLLTTWDHPSFII